MVRSIEIEDIDLIVDLVERTLSKGKIENIRQPGYKGVYCISGLRTDLNVGGIVEADGNNKTFIGFGPIDKDNINGIIQLARSLDDELKQTTH